MECMLKNLPERKSNEDFVKEVKAHVDEPDGKVSASLLLTKFLQMCNVTRFAPN